MVLSNLWKNSSKLKLKIKKNQSHQVFSQEMENRRRKTSKKRKSVTFDDSEDKEADEGHKGKTFCQNHDTYEYTMEEFNKLKAIIRQGNRRRTNISEKRKD